MASTSVSVVVEIAPICTTPQIFRAVCLEKGAKLFGRDQIASRRCGDIAPFKGVRAQPVDDDDVFVKGIERRAMFER